MFRQLIANNTLNDWTYAALAAAAFMLLLLALRWLVLHYLKRVAKSTETVIDDFLIDVVSATRVLLAVTIGLYLGSHFLTLPTTMEKWGERIFVIALILQLGFWASRGLIFWLRYYFSQGEEENQGARTMTLSLLSFLGQVVVWVLVLLSMLDNLGINVTALVASLGIGGIAIALAAQNILGDLFASLTIAIDKPFAIGDFIILGNEMGTVEHVGLKTTRIRSLGGEQIVLSNSDLLQSRIHNYKRMDERRALFAIGVTYDTPAEKLELIPKLIEQAVAAQTGARFDRAHFKSFGAFSLDFETVYYVRKPDYNLFMDVQQAINLQLVRSFTEHGIAFAFPTQTLHLNGGTAPAGPWVAASHPGTTAEAETPAA